MKNSEEENFTSFQNYIHHSYFTVVATLKFIQPGIIQSFNIVWTSATTVKFYSLLV